MKKIAALCLAVSLAIGTVGTAQADWGRHGGGHRPHYQGGHRASGPGWVGPAAILAITGLAIGAAAYSQTHAAPAYVAPAYVEPQRGYYQALPPDSGNWYYCGSAGQYYPYVQSCQEGWQTVMPPR